MQAIEVDNMAEFITETLKISADGILNFNELVAVIIGIVLVIIVLLLFKNQIANFLNRVTPGRKKTIFSHRKNQYKNRIGKGSKASKKKK